MAPPEPLVRLAIACMTKQPINFDVWLRHHVVNLGATKIFLRVESTPELRTLVESAQYRNIVRATYDDRPLVRDNGSAQTERQVQFVNAAIATSRSEGLTHLLHLDDDELCYAPGGRDKLFAALHRLGDSLACSALALTIEAQAPSADCVCPFTEVECFRHRPADFGSYGNDANSTGKSFGVLRFANLECDGPHHFRLRSDSGHSAAAGYGRTAALPPPLAVTLHYESCTLARWRRKFRESAIYNRMRRSNEMRSIEEHIRNSFADPLDEDAQQLRQSVVARHARELGGRAGSSRADCTAGFGSSDGNFKQRFYGSAERVCLAELEAEESGDEAAIAFACAASQRVWEEWKLAPADLPSLKPGEAHRVLHADHRGITLVAPLGLRANAPPLVPSQAPSASPSNAQSPTAVNLISLLKAAGVPAMEVAAALSAAAAAEMAVAAEVEEEALERRVLAKLRDPEAHDAFTRRAGLRVGHRLKVKLALKV